jgi:LacI family transcriptional regulator
VMDIGNPFFTDVLRGVEDSVQGRGYHVQASNSALLIERESEQLRVLEQQRVGGVLWAPISGPSDRGDALRRRGIPVVIVDRAGDGTGYCSVSVDDVEGGRLATDHLLSLGHTSIALVGGPGTLHQVRDRRLGAEIARSQHGSAASLLIVSTDSTDSSAGVVAADQLVGLPDSERPTAVFAMNDLLAIGLLQGFVTHGLRVPEDVALIGYDDISFAASAAVPLSSVRQPRAALGARGVELLIEEMDAVDHDLPHEHQSVRFTPELVVRRSTSYAR